MKRVKLIPLFLTLTLLVSCSLGKKYVEKPSATTTIGQNTAGVRNPDSVESYLRSGVENLQKQAYKNAVQELRKALVLEPHNPHIYYYLALAEQKRGHLDDAVESYRAALKNNPAIYEANFNLAVVYSLQRKYDLAMEQYYQALNIHPDDPELHYNMALCFDQMGKTNQSISEYQRVHQLDPQMVEPYLQLATLYEGQGKIPEAINEYQKVLKVSPDLEMAKKKMVVLSARQKEGEKVSAEAKTKKTAEAESTKGVLARLLSYPKKLFVGNAEKSTSTKESAGESVSKKFRLSLDNKLVSQKKVSFENNAGDNTIDSKRSIARLGYAPGFWKNTQVYVNLGSVSMGFNDDVNMSSQVGFEKATAFAYGAGLSSDLYTFPEYPLGFKLNMDLLQYSPKLDGNSGHTHVSATADLTEYQIAADTVYRGFSKFSPYLGLLYAKSSGSLELSSNTTEKVNFDEKNQIGCRIGTGYRWRDNIGLSAEYRLLDETALSVGINYVF